MKTCPLCQRIVMEKWPNGDMKIDLDDLSALRLFGYSLTELRKALYFAIASGWDKSLSEELGK